MNIRKIIREELNTLSDSFYLIVSDDENFIYGTGKLGGKGFQPVGDFNAEAILRSRYNSENEALDQIRWAKRYENDSKVGGSLTTAGEIANNILKHNPKIVPVDFILKKRDQNFPMMESEMDDFGWAKEVNPFIPGKDFSEDDICFDDYTCEININDNEIKFVLDWDDWVEKVELDDDSKYFVEDILYHGTDYDGGGDYYEFDSDEFNYSYPTDEQKGRFQKILDFTTKGEKKIDYYTDGNQMLDIDDVLRYPELLDLFDSLVSDYLSEIGYAVQKNRWLSIGREMENRIKKTDSEWSLYSGTLEIDVPMEVVWKWYGDGIDNLTDLLIKVSEPITEIYWYDWFYGDFDSSGAEVDEIFDRFLDRAEEYIEEGDVEEVEEKLNLLDSLNMEKLSSGWSRWGNNFRRINPNNTYWYITLDYDFDNTKLELYREDDNRWRTKARKKFEGIPFEELPKYLEQYNLDPNK
jgi:hypothetical protein